MKKTKRSDAKFQPGDTVSFDFGKRRVAALVIEDLDRPAPGKQRVYRIRADLPGVADAVAFEMCEGELEGLA